MNDAFVFVILSKQAMDDDGVSWGLHRRLDGCGSDCNYGKYCQGSNKGDKCGDCPGGKYQNWDDDYGEQVSQGYKREKGSEGE